MTSAHPGLRVAAAILFDLDGTLVDTLGDLAASVNFALESLGRPPRTPQQVRGWVGNGVPELLKGALGPDGHADLPRALELFRPHYDAHCADRSVLYPGAAETLARLDGRFLLGMVTNKPEAPSRRILSALGVAGRFRVLVGGDSLPVRKPDPETVREAARRLGVPPASAVLVGDSAGDVAAAHGAGALAVGALFGYRPAEELRAADAAVERFSDLIPLLEA